LIAIAADQQQPAAERLAAGIAQFTDALADNAPIVRAWLEAIVLAGHDEELRRTLADNQSEFRRALASTLAEAGSEQAEQRAAAIVSVCDGLIVRFMLHGESARVDEVARSAATALQTGSET
jgi:hypothetical protein